jgi:hypothetical protein
MAEDAEAILRRTAIWSDCKPDTQIDEQAMVDIIRETIRCISLDSHGQPESNLALSDAVDCVIQISHGIGDEYIAAARFAAAIEHALAPNRPARAVPDHRVVPVLLARLECRYLTRPPR